ncbi:LysR family transcriptional regulator [Lutimaribacter sp. EGI FJ00015]|uniref:LysR family transcriptional regulator n=1 Tax=Lutimaribacter degradans TaxID=2945989 RepID=A0ACC5ZZF8_9RHOB|nr:LysR family transcriptional regulator [Lutimaribacter sp. EGI FJ00013]MCM2563476.1 LysR family transcriptional regulator [Lutimaribacter sp. EGI FJ00013]MCO0614656.1 LysR family transcriptional regulator [Lutimaribacter sp. EGI FJ00015]MCO0637327.1 LysR family transcriptional regulator [Lutimaribacter sp. EGI FJ00014]
MAPVLQSQSILFELLRSFTTLARTLNLSHAVKELNSTRQTVRRHISQLEELRGEELFKVVDRQYVLTDAGQRALPEATDLLARGVAWAKGYANHSSGLSTINYSDDGLTYHLQQQRISKIWDGDNGFMRTALRSWAMAGGQIEDPAMALMRPYLLIYRRQNDSWICCEIGEESAFASWFGWAKARSSIGSQVEMMPGGGVIASLMEKPLTDIETSHGIRLDHVFTKIPREDGGELVSMAFQRLNLGGRFPDGSFALISVVQRTYDVEIDHLDEETIRTMPPELVMPVPEKLQAMQSFVA